MVLVEVWVALGDDTHQVIEHLFKLDRLLVVTSEEDGRRRRITVTVEKRKVHALELLVPSSGITAPGEEPVPPPAAKA